MSENELPIEGETTDTEGNRFPPYNVQDDESDAEGNRFPPYNVQDDESDTEGNRFPPYNVHEDAGKMDYSGALKPDPNTVS